MSGEMISAASIRSSGLEPARHLARQRRLDRSNIRVAELSALRQLEDSRRFRADRRPLLGRERHERCPSGLRQVRHGGGEQGLLLVGGRGFGERLVDRANAHGELAKLLVGGGARLARGEVVDRLDPGPGRFLPEVRLDGADVLVGARRDDVGRGHGPDLDLQALRTKSTPRIVARTTIRAIAAIPRRSDLAPAEGRGGSAGRVSTASALLSAWSRGVPAGVVDREICGRQRPRDELAHMLPVGAAAGLRGEPAHHLAHVTRR